MLQPLIVPKDSDFRKTKLLPHIGEHYGKVMPYGLPVLVLGESHYGYPAGTELRRTFTREVIQESVEEINYPFLTKSVGVFEGGWPDIDTRRIFWRTAAFCNFIQVSVGEEARIRPTEAMWAGAGAALEETLMCCMPGFVLVLGIEMWNNLPIPLQPGPVVKCGTETNISRLYFNDNGYAFTFGIAHPASVGWSYNKWTPWVRAALAEAIKFQNS